MESPVTRRDPKQRAGWLRRIVTGPGTTSQANLSHLLSLADLEGRHSVLVLGGAEPGVGMELVRAQPRMRVTVVDIYSTPEVDVVGDGHLLPFRDGSFDVVILQAVLEHVAFPAEVVGEVRRILSAGGLVYSETPFMQQVHEGAYDFSRYTDTGHRLLFRGFEPLGHGTLQGPGVALQWAIEYFVRALFRSPVAGKVSRMATFWLRWFDPIMDGRHALDGACGVFFLGRKRCELAAVTEVVRGYAGAQTRAPDAGPPLL